MMRRRGRPTVIGLSQLVSVHVHVPDVLHPHVDAPLIPRSRDMQQKRSVHPCVGVGSSPSRPQGSPPCLCFHLSPVVSNELTSIPLAFLLLLDVRCSFRWTDDGNTQRRCLNVPDRCNKDAGCVWALSCAGIRIKLTLGLGPQ